MGKLFSMHPSDDQLDLYLVGHLSIQNQRLIEEHYLGCAICADRLSATADFVAALRAVQVDSPHLLNHHPAAFSVLHRKSIARFAAILLAVIGTPILCHAPAPLRDPLPKPAAAHVLQAATVGVSRLRPLEIPQRVRSTRQRTPIRRSRAYRDFRPPPLPPGKPVAVEMIELPDDLIIPCDSPRF